MASPLPSSGLKAPAQPGPSVAGNLLLPFPSHPPAPPARADHLLGGLWQLRRTEWERGCGGGQNRAPVPAWCSRPQSRNARALGRRGLLVPPPLPCKKCLVTASARPRWAGRNRGVSWKIWVCGAAKSFPKQLFHGRGTEGGLGQGSPRGREPTPGWALGKVSARLTCRLSQGLANGRGGAVAAPGRAGPNLRVGGAGGPGGGAWAGLAPGRGGAFLQIPQAAGQWAGPGRGAEAGGALPRPRNGILRGAEQARARASRTIPRPPAPARVRSSCRRRRRSSSSARGSGPSRGRGRRGRPGPGCPAARAASGGPRRPEQHLPPAPCGAPGPPETSRTEPEGAGTMNKLRQSLRRRKPAYVPEASRPHQWQADEDAVRKGTCSFPVRYLGHVEVEESRGMHVCEDAVKKLKAMGRKSVKSVLWVSADGLRVVDDKTKDLLVDQTIEKVSFCAPDRNLDKAFSYICRDGTTRRWICHCFLALKDSGERLSHAVGCAFAACLERKQRREKECGVTAAFDASRTSFAREGSFRLSGGGRPTEREAPEKKKAEAAAAPTAAPGPAQPGHVSPTPATTSPGEKGEAGTPVAAGTSAAAIPRRHAPLEQLVRQGSFRGFPALSQKNSPFKRQLSLRLNELPSTLQRRTDFQVKGTVPEMEPPGASDSDGINALCTQISSSFASAGAPAPGPPAASAGTSAWGESSVPPAAAFQPGHKRTPSEAERWLEEVSQVAKAQQQQQQQQAAAVAPVAPALQPFPAPVGPFDATPAQVAVFLPPPHMQPPFVPTYPGLGYPPMPRVPVVGITPSQMVANAFCSAAQLQPQPATLLGKAGAFPPPAMPTAPGAQVRPRPNGAPWPPEPAPAPAPELDPFEAQWAALEGKPAVEKPSNPFSGDLQKTFEIEL